MPYAVSEGPDQFAIPYQHTRTLADSEGQISLRVYSSVRLHITKTCRYNFDPIKPHFYIVKLGFTGVYITFHISAQNITSTHNLCFEQIYEKYQNFLSENFLFFFFFFFLFVKFSIYLNKRVFVMICEQRRPR